MDYDKSKTPTKNANMFVDDLVKEIKASDLTALQAYDYINELANAVRDLSYDLRYELKKQIEKEAADNFAKLERIDIWKITESLDNDRPIYSADLLWSSADGRQIQSPTFTSAYARERTTNGDIERLRDILSAEDWKKIQKTLTDNRLSGRHDLDTHCRCVIAFDGKEGASLKRIYLTSGNHITEYAEEMRFIQKRDSKKQQGDQKA